jgi:hypothetical protein
MPINPLWKLSSAPLILHHYCTHSEKQDPRKCLQESGQYIDLWEPLFHHECSQAIYSINFGIWVSVWEMGGDECSNNSGGRPNMFITQGEFEADR